MADSKKTLADLKREIEQEMKRQKEHRDEIKKAQIELRDLRKKKSDIAEERAKNEEQIRDIRIELSEDREIARDKSLPDSIRSQAVERIQEHGISLRGTRSSISKQDASIAGINTKVQRSLGNREHQESLLTSSRTNQREMMSRSRMMEAVDNLSPGQVKGDLSKNIAPDAQLEGMRAGHSVRKMGGTKGEAADAEKASNEFYSLFQAIKETKKALAGLTEGSAEYQKKQEELIDVEGKATDALTKLEKVERDVEKRKLGGGDGGGGTGARIAGGAASFIGGAAKFGSDAFSQLGQSATERYVLEEQKKQAQYQLRNMALTDTRNRTEDATSFLSTGGAGLFGAESPFNRKGGVNGRIGKLGQDYADTRESVKQYGFAMDTVSGMAGVASSSLDAGIRGAAGNPLTGAGAALGPLISGGANLALDTAKRGMLTPEIAGRFGGQKVSQFGDDMAAGAGDIANSLGKGVGGYMLEKGGGDKAKFEQGLKEFTGAVTQTAQALPRVLTRAYDSVEQMNKLISAEQSGAQAGRVRERLAMAFAPAMQQYMDVQGAQGANLRSRSMGRGEREKSEAELERFSLDEDLTKRGFGPGEILDQTAGAAQMMGRFGAGGRNERVAKSAMMAESMGMGSASQNTNAMGKMVAGGIKDPEAMFAKAMKEGLERGLQDSRQFQELLNAAQETSEGVGDFGGALTGIMTFAGSGRSNDVATARAASTKAEDRMSGFTGTWRDMVKVDVTNKAAKGAMAAADKAGIQLSRDDKTSLANLANLKPEQLENEDYLNSILTSGAKKAISASGKNVKQYGSSIANSLRVHSSMDGAVNATQSKDLAELRNMLADQDYAGIKAKYGNNPEKIKNLVALAGSGATSENDVKAGIGDQQAIVNGLSKAGVNTDGMGLQQAFKPKDINQAVADSAPGNTAFEQGRKGKAEIGAQNMARAMTTRGPDGKNNIAAELGQTGEMYRQQSDAMAKDVTKDRTVDPKLEVKRIDQAVDEMVKGLKDMKEAFKDFSTKDFVVNAGKDVVIQGANAIKGVILDNGLTQAATEAGKAIANAVKSSMPGGGGDSAPAAKSAASSKSVSAPLGAGN